MPDSWPNLLLPPSVPLNRYRAPTAQQTGFRAQSTETGDSIAKCCVKHARTIATTADHACMQTTTTYLQPSSRVTGQSIAHPLGGWCRSASAQAWKPRATGPVTLPVQKRSSPRLEAPLQGRWKEAKKKRKGSKEQGKKARLIRAFLKCSRAPGLLLSAFLLAVY